MPHGTRQDDITGYIAYDYAVSHPDDFVILLSTDVHPPKSDILNLQTYKYLKNIDDKKIELCFCDQSSLNELLIDWLKKTSLPTVVFTEINDLEDFGTLPILHLSTVPNATVERLADAKKSYIKIKRSAYERENH
jgi:hypothetical protein